MNDDTTDDLDAPVAIVGAGAVGTALARRLAARSGTVRAVLSRDPASARALAERVGAVVASDAWTALPDDVRLVLICVPDEAIGSVAEALAEVSHPWAQTLVGHTSGAHAAEALAPLADRGAPTMSFHPLQTFAPGAPPEAFANIVVGIEGDPDAVSAGQALARTLGARPLVLTGRAKALYHCAAVLASNGLVALMSAVEEVLAAAELDDPPAATDLLAPLVEQTWANLEEASPEGVLTGPVARGDEATLRTHLDGLQDTAPHLVPLYAALSTEMVRTAVRGGQIDGETAEGVLRLLREAVSTDGDSGDSTDFPR